MNIQNATATLFLDTRRAKSDNKYPLKLTIYCQQDKRRYSTKISLTENEWDKINGPKLKDEELKKVKRKLGIIITRANNILEELDPFSFEDFESKYFIQTAPKVDLSLAFWFEEYINQLDAQGREGTRGAYRTALNSFLTFEPDLILTDITAGFLELYEDYMRKQGKSPSTIGIYLRELRAILNRAIKAGAIKKEQYPFKHYQIPASRNIKKALTDKQLEALLNYQAKNRSQEQALDFWVLSYLCNGMNVTDLLHLKPENIGGSFLYFNRQKTIRTKKKDLRPIKVPLNKRAINIINKWKNGDKTNPFLFSVLTDGISAKTIKQRIQKFLKKVNAAMEEIRVDLGFECKLGTYVARHSFSTRLMRSGVSSMYIKESLGHSTVSVTENYLGDFADEAKLEYADLLVNFK
ncbi:MAG TPA: site-specific integrase [Sediminibacterium sp.]